MYPISNPPRAIVATIAAAAAIFAASAAVAFAKPLTFTSRGCYVVRQPVQLGGFGFAPSQPLAVAIEGVFLPGSLSTDSQGSFSTTLHPGGLPAGAVQHVDHVLVKDGSVVSATTRFTLTRSAGAHFTVMSGTGIRLTGRFRVWGFALNGVERAVYLHYVGPKGRQRTAVLLGTTGGACGYLVSRRRRLFPFTPSRGRWTLQVDTSQSYSRQPGGPVARIRISIS